MSAQNSAYVKSDETALDRALAALWEIRMAAERASVNDPVWLLPTTVIHLAEGGMGGVRPPRPRRAPLVAAVLMPAIPEGLTPSGRAAFERGAAQASAETAAAGVVDIRLHDLAKIGPCPGCGVPVRRLNVPIKGHGLDASPADAAHCPDCLAAPTRAAADAVRASREAEQARPEREN